MTSTLQHLDRESFLKLLGELEDPVFVNDAEHRWVYVNEAYQKLILPDAGNLIGKKDEDFFPEEQYTVFYVSDD